MSSKNSITIGQVVLLRRLADGERLVLHGPTPKNTRWMFERDGKRSVINGAFFPRAAETRGYIMWNPSGSHMQITNKGRAVLARVDAGELIVLPAIEPKARKPRPKKPVQGLRPYRPTAPAGRCWEHHGATKAVCECGVQFCRTCEPERNGVCAFCEEDKRMARREPSRTFGVESRIALRMVRGEGRG